MEPVEKSSVIDEENVSTWKKKDLVQWLVDHKKKKSGSKPVLINRIIRSLRFDDSSDSDWDSDVDGDTNNDLPNISSVKAGWEAITTNLCPPTRTEDVENYFIYNKNPISGKTQPCHRQLQKAKKFSKEGYVHEIEYNGLENSPYCYVKAKCKPSMKEVTLVGDGRMSRHYTLHAVLIKSTGRIEGGRCNCKPGLTGLCSHIGGLLLSLVEINNACTSKGCEWLKPQTDLQMKPHRLRDIKFSTSSDAPIKPYPDVYQAGPCKDPELFLADIMAGLGKVNPTSVLYQTLDPLITDLSYITEKYQPPFTYMDSVNLNSTVCQSEFRAFTMGIELSDDDIKKVQISTKGQSSNPVWKDIRTNLITASNFGAVCKKRPDTEPDNLISKLRGYSAHFDSKPTRYGRKKEGQARRDYAREHMDTCGKVSVETTGLLISKQFPYLGASVDGLVKCDKCGTGALEIKCPYIGRNVMPEEWAGMKSSCVERSESGNMLLKGQHNYMYQVMGQMKVLGLDWCDFVIWTKKGIHVERIKISEEFWMNNMMFKLKYFYNSFFLAERFTDRVKRGKKLFD